MGMTDQFIIPKYSSIVSEFINKNLKPNSKIAWLGQQQEDKYSDMYRGISRYIKVPNLIHHFYDIKNDDNSDNSFSWEVHSNWEKNIRDYDLVLGLRLAFLVQSSSGLARNIKFAVDNNKKVMFDFNTGNISTNTEPPFQRWNEGSTNLIPHFPELFPFELDYIVPNKDHLFSSDLLREQGLTFRDPIVIKDPVKGRIYVLTEFVKL